MSSFSHGLSVASERRPSGFVSATHGSASAFTVAARTLLAFVLPAVLAIAGSIVACYNDVPGPQGPLPSPMREVPPQGPAPGPIIPGPVSSPHIVPTLDGGLPVPAPPPQSASPSASQSASQTGARVASVAGSPSPRLARSPARLLIPLSVAPASDPPPPTQPQQPPPKQAPPVDAGVDSTADLPPELPDAGLLVTPDAGEPLAR